MRWQWLHRAGQGKLLIFCNGWGMDGEVVSHLQPGDFDIMMLYDYASLKIPNEVDAALAAASSRFLLGWSMGVWVGSLLFSESKFDAAVAYNGTPCPIDKRFGISPAIFYATLENFNEKNRADFYRRMCGKKDFPLFLQHLPQRELDNQQQELAFFWNSREEMAILQEQGLPWQRAVIARKDMVIPSRNQRAFWEKQLLLERVAEIDGGHYPFSLSSRWSDYLAL